MQPKLELQKRARELYQAGQTYNQIYRTLGVAKSSISLWCSDLAAERRGNQAAARPLLPRMKLPPIKIDAQAPYLDYWISHLRIKGHPGLVRLTHRETGEKLTLSVLSYTMAAHLGRRLTPNERVKRIDGPGTEIENLQLITVGSGLTSEIVATVRQMAHDNPRLDVAALCLEYNVSDNAMRAAIKGRSYTYMNDTAPPYTGRLFQPRLVKTLREQRRDTIREALMLRRGDPERWTYERLADWLSDKTGRKYKASNAKFALRKQDPTITELDPPAESKRNQTKVRVIERGCVICEQPFQTKSHRTEVCQSQECRRTLRQYSRFR